MRICFFLPVLCQFVLFLSTSGCVNVRKDTLTFQNQLKNELEGKLQSYYLTPEEKLHWERHYVCKTAGVESPYLTPDETDGQPASTPWKAAEGLFFKRDPKRLPQLPSPATISQQFSYPPFEYYKLNIACISF